MGFLEIFATARLFDAFQESKQWKSEQENDEEDLLPLPVVKRKGKWTKEGWKPYDLIGNEITLHEEENSVTIKFWNRDAFKEFEKLPLFLLETISCFEKSQNQKKTNTKTPRVDIIAPMGQ